MSDEQKFDEMPIHDPTPAELIRAIPWTRLAEIEALLVKVVDSLEIIRERWGAYTPIGDAVFDAMARVGDIVEVINRDHRKLFRDDDMSTWREAQK